MPRNYFTFPMVLIASFAAGCVFLATIAGSQLSKKEAPVGHYSFKAGDYVDVDAAPIARLTPYNSPTHIDLKIKSMKGCVLAVLYTSSEVTDGTFKMTFEPKYFICQNDEVSGSMSASYYVGNVTIAAIDNSIEHANQSDINIVAPTPDIRFLVLNNFNWARGYLK